MVSLEDSSNDLLASCGQDTVKLFDMSIDRDDPCVASYTPSPGCQVNSVKWNHTNMVVASAGHDKKISLWRNNGQMMGIMLLSRSDIIGEIDASTLSINFGNQSARYLCSGGTGKVVRIWDLKAKQCIKALSGHTGTITGVMFNCKDEHLASVSLRGDLIIHKLSTGALASLSKDPHRQMLRALDYSRYSCHVLVTTGDDGSLHLWDTTRNTPNVSWVKQHSAPTTGVCFSPLNDKIVLSVGLDKKYYLFDLGSRNPTKCVSYVAPLSSVAFRDDGWMVAVGASDGSIVLYDVRGKSQPLKVLRGYNNFESVNSLCWQRLRPIIVNENRLHDESVLIGHDEKHTILIPDPAPSSFSSTFSSKMLSNSHDSMHFNSSIETSPLNIKDSGIRTTSSQIQLLSGITLSRLRVPHAKYNFKDDMEIFSPLVDVDLLTPSPENLWDNDDEENKDFTNIGKSTLIKGLHPEGKSAAHPINDCKSNTNSGQVETQCSPLSRINTSTSSSKSDDSHPPEFFGSEVPSPDKFKQKYQPAYIPSRFMPTINIPARSIFAGSHDLSGASSNAGRISPTQKIAISRNLDFKIFPSADFISNHSESSSSFQHDPSSTTARTRDEKEHINNDHSQSVSLINRREMSTYTGGKSTISSLCDADIAIGSPKVKKAEDCLSDHSVQSSGFQLDPVSSSTATRRVKENNDNSQYMPIISPRKTSSFIDRKSVIPSLCDASIAVGSPKVKKTEDETWNEQIKNSFYRSQTPNARETRAVTTNEVAGYSQKVLPIHDDGQETSPFILQTIQHTLEESFTLVRNSIDERLRNLHIEVLRQFHMQEEVMTDLMKSVLENQVELMKEVKILREENKRLHRLLLIPMSRFVFRFEDGRFI